jgi:DNA-binding XRE family transcriptional regulator
MHLGRLVKEKRIGDGMTQAQLAERLGVHRVTVSRIEGGHQRCSLPTLLSICRVLRIDVDQALLGKRKRTSKRWGGSG